MFSGSQASSVGRVCRKRVICRYWYLFPYESPNSPVSVSQLLSLVLANRSERALMSFSTHEWIARYGITNSTIEIGKGKTRVYEGVPERKLVTFSRLTDNSELWVEGFSGPKFSRRSNKVTGNDRGNPQGRMLIQDLPKAYHGMGESNF